MMNPRSRILAAVAGVLSLGAAAAWAETPQDARIRELEAKVAALEAKQNAASQDLASTIEAVLRDAQNRSQLLADGGGVTAGYKNGFFIQSEDGSFLLRPGLQFQFRSITNFRTDTGGSDEDTLENGFEIRRMKLAFTGNLFSKDLAYAFQWAHNRDTGNGLELEDAWVRYKFADDWFVRAGQFKSPIYHEELNSSKYQLAVDRSLANELIGGGFTDYTQGVSLIYGGNAKDNPISAEMAFTDGFNQDNTDFRDRGVAFNNDEPAFNVLGSVGRKTIDFGVDGRVEWLVTGDWGAYKDFSARGNTADLFVLGAGAGWNQAGDGNILVGTVDAQYETGPWTFYGAVLFQQLDEGLVEDVDGDAQNWGGVAQAGYMLNKSWEAFGRYSMVVADEELAVGNGEDTFHEITVGLNYYMGRDGSWGHAAKFTIDLMFLPNGAPAANSGIGILDANGGEHEWILRGQFQLLI